MLTENTGQNTLMRINRGAASENPTTIKNRHFYFPLVMKLKE